MAPKVCLLWSSVLRESYLFEFTDFYMYVLKVNNYRIITSLTISTNIHFIDFITLTVPPIFTSSMSPVHFITSSISSVPPIFTSSLHRFHQFHQCHLHSLHQFHQYTFSFHRFHQCHLKFTSSLHQCHSTTQ